MSSSSGESVQVQVQENSWIKDPFYATTEKLVKRLEKIVENCIEIDKALKKIENTQQEQSRRHEKLKRHFKAGNLYYFTHCSC